MTGEVASTSQASPTRAEQSAVRSLLRSYATAFSSSDVGLLRTIFAADVVRRGMVGGRCETRRGVAGVLSAYRTEFVGSYSLTPLPASAIRTDGPSTVYVPDRFTIHDSAGVIHGLVDFTIRDEPGGWRIARVTAACA